MGKSIEHKNPKQNDLEFGGSLKGAQIPKRGHYTDYLLHPEEIRILNWDLDTCKQKGWVKPDWLQWYEEKKKEYGL